MLGYRLLPSRDERWSVVRSTPLLTPDGEVQLVVNVFRDITKERREEERIHFLGEASTLLAASLDYEATLADLAKLLVPRVADYCIVDALDEDGALRQVVISHRDPAREELLREVRRRYPPEKNEAHPVSEVLRSGEPYLVEDARQEALSRTAVDEEHLALYRALEATSYIVVPLEARGRLLGTISLGTGESRRRFGAVDLELAHEIARRAALAIDNALLFGTAQQSYAQLDTLLVSAPVGIGFWDRDLRFIRVNDALAAINGLTPEEHVGKPLAEVIGELSPVLEPLYRRVLESGEPVVHTESTDDEALRMGERRHWLSSYYPVRTRRRRGDRRRRRDHGDHRPEARRRPAAPARRGRRALLELARPGGDRLADRSGGGAEARRHLQRLSRRRDHAQARRLRQRRPGGPAGARVAARRRSPSASPSRAASQVCTARAEPLLLQTVPAEYLDELSRFGVDPAAFSRIGTRSLMLLPIVARGQTRGVITLGSRQPDRFDEHDVDLGQELAGRAGVAMDNARLVGELRRRAQAAQALEFVGDGVFLVGSDGTIRLWNPAAARITGLGESDVVGLRAESTLADWPLEHGERASADVPLRRAATVSSGSR